MSLAQTLLPLLVDYADDVKGYRKEITGLATEITGLYGVLSFLQSAVMKSEYALATEAGSLRCNPADHQAP